VLDPQYESSNSIAGVDQLPEQVCIIKVTTEVGEPRWKILKTTEFCMAAQTSDCY
jgi:hypothetical protein